MTGSLKATMKAKALEEHVPETLDVVGMEARLTKTERVINRRAENIKLTSETRL